MADFKFSAKLEANEEDIAVAWAENNGWLVRKMKYAGRRGCPDRFFFGFGQIVMIEFKKDDTDLDPQQVREHLRLHAAGVPPFVCHNSNEAIEILVRFMHGLD